MAGAWQSIGASRQQAAMTYCHNKGAKVLVSTGGATDTPYGGSATTYGQTAANFAKNNNLDGVDFDLENFPYGPMSAANVNWVATATNAARAILPSPKLITHAPQTPYFDDRFDYGYTKIYKAAPSIDYLLIQYYNNDNPVTYAQIFTTGDSGKLNSIKQISNQGIPLNKLVLGKPVNSGDGNQWLSASQLNSIIKQAKTNLGWTGGVMGWQWHDYNINQAWIAAVMSGF